MKLLSFRYGDKDSYGLVSGERVLDLGCHLEHPNLRSALAAGALPEIAALARREAADLALSKIEFLPVIPDAGKIICVGRNYLDHVNEGNNKPTEKPMLFSRFPSSHVGHREPLVRPFVSTHFDYEGELAVIIGKVARHVKAEQALDYVAGYTCFNDGSVRDWQKHTHQLLQGKTFWRSGVFFFKQKTAYEISRRTGVQSVLFRSHQSGPPRMSLPWLQLRRSRDFVLLDSLPRQRQQWPLQHHWH